MSANDSACPTRTGPHSVGRPEVSMAEVEFHLHNEVGIKFPPLRPAYSDGELFFGRFRALVSRRTGSSSIGEGGTGRIHLVRDELMEREVALKIPLDSILRDPAARDDVIQETRQAMDLTHPNIVRIHDFHEEGERWGISMQYVRGKNLDEWRYENEASGFRRAIRPYAVEAIRDWIAQVCDALRYAHEDARMVHRDIKPKNLMLEKRDGGEKVYITDFGISQRLRQHTLTLSRDQNKAGDSKANMGTLPYMPWEQIAGGPASPLDDVYAVGATIYELITGRPPFYDGGFEQIKVQIRETPPPTMEQRILDLGLHVPPPPDEWEEVVAACLAKRPEDRPQSMRAVAAALGFQSGSNTQLEARVTSQTERINELENQIITLSHPTAPAMPAVDPEVENQLATTRQQLAELQQHAELSQANLQRLEAALADARRTHDELATRLQSTQAERDAALQGGDVALRQFQEDSAKRIALAEDKVHELQHELDAAQAAADASVKQAKQAAQQKISELEGKLQGSEQRTAQEVQAARKEAERAFQANVENARREAEQLAEQLKKAEASNEKALSQVRDEADKRLRQQTEELAKTREGLTKLTQQKEQLERAVAVEKARQGAPLRPVFISLLLAMILGLGGGYGWSVWRNGRAAPTEAIRNLPEKDQIAEAPVAFDLFERFAKAMGTTAAELGGSKGAGDAVFGVSGVTAMNFCNWLTEANTKPDDHLHYTLPDIDQLKGKVGEGTKEWSKTWAKDRAGQVLEMRGKEKGEEATYDVHALHSAKDFTFRITLEALPER